MEKLLDLEQEIKRDQEEAKRAKELYQLLSSYNAYSILLMKANKEYHFSLQKEYMLGAG